FSRDWSSDVCSSDLFRHDLVREAVERALPPGRRREAHAAVLAALEARGEPATVGRRERLTALAHHAAEAGDAAAVLRYAVAAGRDRKSTRLNSSHVQ